MINRRSFLGATGALVATGAGLAAAPWAFGAQRSEKNAVPSRLAFSAARHFDTWLGEQPGLAFALLAAARGLTIVVSARHPRAQNFVAENLARMPDRGYVLTSELWAGDAESAANQINRTLAQFSATQLDLVQVNLNGRWQEQLAMLRERQAQGRIKQLGVVVRHRGQYAAAAAAIKSGQIDSLRLGYSAAESEPANYLMPLAQDRDVKLVSARPFAGGRLIESSQGLPIPGWAAEKGYASWDQLWLGFALAHPAVSAVMPGVSEPEHIAANRTAIGLPKLSGSEQRQLKALASSLA